MPTTHTPLRHLSLTTSSLSPFSSSSKSIEMSTRPRSVRGIHADVFLSNATTAPSSSPTSLRASPQSPSTKLSAPDGPQDVAARVHRLEGTILNLEKQLKRLESVIATKSSGRNRAKMLIINYDVGPDAKVDSVDIAVGAAWVFGFLGLMIGRSIASNLWFVGFLTGAMWAGFLAREEEGGAISDVIRAVGWQVAVKTRQLVFMYRTGRLSYIYAKKWEAFDRKYAVLRKMEALQKFSLKKWMEVEEAEKKYEVRYRLTSFLKAGYNGAVDGTAKLFNAKDRKDLVKKLPRPFRLLFMSKAQRKAEDRRRVTVRRFVGLQNGRPVVEVEDG